MFHYRWAFAADIEFASQVLPRWSAIDRSDAEIAPLSKQFAERQIGRLGVVGSNPTTAPVIEASYRRLLALLDARLAESPFVLGASAGRVRLRALRPAHAARRLRPDADGDRARGGAARRAPGSTASRICRGSTSARRRLDRARTRCRRRCARCSARSAACTRRSCSRTRARSRRSAARVECDDRRAAVGAAALPVPGQVPARAARGLRARSRMRERAQVDAALAGSGCEVLF